MPFALLYFHSRKAKVCKGVELVLSNINTGTESMMSFAKEIKVLLESNVDTMRDSSMSIIEHAGSGARRAVSGTVAVGGKLVMDASGKPAGKEDDKSVGG